MFRNVPHVQNKIRLHVKYLLNVNSLEIIWSSFLLLILIKNAIKNAVKENPENQNSEIAANINEITRLNLHLMNNVTTKFIQVLSFLEILQNSQENTYISILKKETLAQVFSCEFCKISKNTFFIEHLRTTASEVK